MSLDQEKLTYSPIHGWIDGPESRPIKVDKWSRAMVTLDNEEHQVNRGYNFLSSASTLVDTGGHLTVLWKTNYSRPRALFEWQVSTAAIFRTYLPSPRIFVPANELVILNTNLHPDSPTSALSVCHTPATTGATETSARKLYLGSASGLGGQVSSGGHSSMKVLFYVNQTIMFDLEATTDDCALTMLMHWSEQIPYDTPPLIVPV